MNLEFKPDIFSDTLPKWRLAGAEFTNTIIEIFNSTQIEKVIFSDLLIEFSGAFEINSSNLRISFSGDKFVLKRWSHKAVPKQLEKLLQTMDWLASNNLPVPVPIKFINGNEENKPIRDGIIILDKTYKDIPHINDYMNTGAL